MLEGWQVAQRVVVLVETTVVVDVLPVDVAYPERDPLKPGAVEESGVTLKAVAFDLSEFEERDPIREDVRLLLITLVEEGERIVEGSEEVVEEKNSGVFEEENDDRVEEEGNDATDEEDDEVIDNGIDKGREVVYEVLRPDELLDVPNAPPDEQDGASAGAELVPEDITTEGVAEDMGAVELVTSAEGTLKVVELLPTLLSVVFGPMYVDEPVVKLAVLVGIDVGIDGDKDDNELVEAPIPIEMDESDVLLAAGMVDVLGQAVSEETTEDGPLVNWYTFKELIDQ
ncbi:MAG: hypothetical protein M1820_007289 [Bogoriella megaspora]|nr:MAG: hypothetical protein M1820_007289 [Bogoriella megaspora]